MGFTVDQGLSFLIALLALIVVAPLLVGLVIALFRQSGRRRVMGSAGVAGGALALGLIMYGAVNQMQNRPIYLTNQNVLLHNVASVIGNVGLTLSSAALILGGVESVRMRRWELFAAFLLVMVAAELFAYLFNFALIILQYFQSSHPLLKRLMEGDRTVTALYFFITSFLLISAPLATFLLAFLGLKRASNEPSSETA
jgi:hypothetical protein